MTITQEVSSLRGTPRRPRRVPETQPEPPGHGPRPLGPLALLDLLQRYVTETADFLPAAEPRLAERQYELLELTDDLEIWAIHWPQGQGLRLHDHGGSVGALWVVAGSLEEHYLGQRQTVAHLSIEAGGGAAFGPTYIHDVVNQSGSYLRLPGGRAQTFGLRDWWWQPAGPGRGKGAGRRRRTSRSGDARGAAWVRPSGCGWSPPRAGCRPHR
jgi:hypothetical protein